MSNFPFLPFKNAPYPCYWLSAEGDFAQNENALQQKITFLGIHPIQCLLINIQKSGLNAPASLISPSGNTLSICPTDEGLLAIETPDSFLPENSVSSNLRESLSNIFALLGLLTRKSDNYDYSITEEIQDNCYKMLRTASNLENTNINSFPCDLLEPVDLSSLMASLFESVETVCRKQQIPFQANIPVRPILVRANAKLLTAGILNIIGNSLQYTRDGNHIYIRLVENNGKAILTIQDYGLGIQPQYLSEIFLPYFSMDPYGDGEPTPGVGLGLSVAHHAVKSSCGTITAESTFGEGTRITISFPIDYDHESDILGSDPADYLLDKFSPIYTYLAGFCRYPDL